ncbi:MAG: tetratricopeptide repeat protein [Candidatus Yanofskybacteria bacterium]|nr:tetratricopeptide repeat protein [Candidatus Yanofskybacteria bacterium]
MFNFSFIRRFWPVLAIIIAGFFIYFFNLHNQLFWDDDDWIINNQFVHSISWDNIKFWFTHNTLAGVGLNSNYYRPFLFFTFAINYMASGIQPLLWHLTSNLIHIANAVLVFVLLRRFSGRLVAFLTALVFTIHPLQTEAVTYIAGRGDSLVVLFMLLALFLFLKSKDSPARSLIYKSASLVSMTVGMLSRETGIIFPFLLMIFYIAFLSADRFRVSIKKAFKEAWLYFGIVIIYGILRLTVLNFQNTLNFYTAPNPYSENLWYRILTFMHVLIDYFRLLLVPTGLHMERSMTVHTSLFQWPVWLGALIIMGLVWLIWHLYRGGDKVYRIWLFGVGWFFIGLGPVSGIVPINAVIYEHWLYLPMIGFWFIAAFYLVKVFNYLKSKPSIFYFLFSIFLLIYFSFFSFQSIKRNILWGKPMEFFEDILKYEPQSARVNNNLGNLYFNQGNTERALEYYERSAEAQDVFAQPLYNIGSILQSRGDIFGAIKEYEKAIEIDPSFHYSYQNLVVIYANQGNLTKAIEYIEILKLLRSNDPRVYYNAALIYLAQNNRSSALENLNQGLEVIGNDIEAEELIQSLLERLK